MPAIDEPVSERHMRARKVDPRYTEGELVRVAGAMNQAEAEFVQGCCSRRASPRRCAARAASTCPTCSPRARATSSSPPRVMPPAREVLLQAEIVRDEPVEMTSPTRLLAALSAAVAVVALIVWLGTELGA